MLLAALLDAGLSLEQLRAELGKLHLQGYSLEAQPAQRGAIRGTHLRVSLDERAQGPLQPHDLSQIVQASALPERVKTQALAVLQRLAEAEARAHRQTVQEVHLHELGTLDTLVDVVGFAIGTHLLGVERVYASPLPTGAGWVRSEHGLLPVPAPATLELMAMARAPVVPPPPGLKPPGEMVTPTGAAIVTTLASFTVPAISVERVGYGLGTRDTPEHPNALAVWLGTVEVELPVGEMALLETNVDDSTPELLGYTQERLLEAGARDVWFTPIQMKKNRPAVQVSVLAPVHLQRQMVEVLLRETSTLGVRFRRVERYEAEREVAQVATSLGTVAVKVKRLEGRVVGVSPEYEECRRVALAQGLPLQEVYQRVLEAARAALMPGRATDKSSVFDLDPRYDA